MANTVTIIRCAGCGAWRAFTKHNALGVFPASNLEPWLDLHGDCHPDVMATTLGSVGFSLHMDDEIGGPDLPIEKQNAEPTER